MNPYPPTNYPPGNQANNAGQMQYPVGFSGMPAPDFSVNTQQGPYPQFGFVEPQYGGYPPNMPPAAYPSQYAPPPMQSGYPNSGSYAPPPQMQQGYPTYSQTAYPNSGPYAPPTPVQQHGYPNLPPPNVNPNYPSPIPATQPPPQQQQNLFPNLAPQSAAAAATPIYYEQQYYQPTLVTYQPFDPVDDAKKLYKAMKGIGTDETTLIDIICRRTCNQRMQIVSNYKTAYGKDLFKDVESETSGNFRIVLKALLIPTIEYEAREVHHAIDGAGTDEIALIDLLCTKTNAQMAELKNMYQQLYRKKMEKEVKDDVSGYFGRLLTSLMNGQRSTAPVDINRAKQLAKELYEAGEKKLGTNEVKFNQIFASESLQQLRAIFDEYYKLTGHDIEKCIRSEMSGDVKDAFLAIAQIAKSAPGYYAERLYKSMKGLGTDDRTLIRNMVLRSEIDLKDIKAEFQKKYSKTLESFIKGDCSGDYKRALLCLAGDPNWRK